MSCGVFLRKLSVVGKVIKLPEEVANRIAAGEVVERPASVVKELLENSLDAGANYIEIFLLRGGKELVQVVDDGEGMSPEDALLALQRHATSKITSAADLEAITTFGFRGEALPSIAAVSVLELVTRKRGSSAAFRVVVDNGEVVEEVETNAPPGTSVSVRELFAKLPARRRFLKSDQTEHSQCLQWITRLALASPQVTFRVEADGRECLYLPAVSDYASRIGQLFGDELLERLLEISHEEGDYSVFGFVGERTLHRSRTSDEYFFLNGRPVRSSLLTGALHKAFAGLLPPRRYPVAFVFVDAPPELVDVNVHPAKLEVRFRREEAVFGAVYRAIAKAVGERPLPAAKPKPSVLVPPPSAQMLRLDLPQSVRPPRQSAPGIEREIADLVSRIASDVEVEPRQAEPQFLQIHEAYIVVQSRDGMLVIDQHAAHERILYERTLRALEESAKQGQRLLFPVEVHIAPHWAPVLTKLLPKLAAVGFEIEIVDQNTARLLSVPSFVHNADYAELVRDVLEELSEYNPESPGIVRRLAASIACHAAIKAGQKLSQDEMGALFDALFECEDPYHCPHGRPTVVKFTVAELERMFGRRD